ncbi:MAG TPA: hypothetical protein VEO01_08545 [Pseudonocardiaceae bacterium]|nr:hypothetical protein [Pseudonocardiaceae bacterium]
MRVRRFQEQFRELLERASATGIAAIEEYAAPGAESRPNLRIRCTDGVTIDLVIVGTAKRGGDDHSKPEVVVVKSEPGVRVC